MNFFPMGVNSYVKRIFRFPYVLKSTFGAFRNVQDKVLLQLTCQGPR